MSAAPWKPKPLLTRSSMPCRPLVICSTMSKRHHPISSSGCGSPAPRHCRSSVRRHMPNALAMSETVAPRCAQRKQQRMMRRPVADRCGANSIITLRLAALNLALRTDRRTASTMSSHGCSATAPTPAFHAELIAAAVSQLSVQTTTTARSGAAWTSWRRTRTVCRLASSSPGSSQIAHEARRETVVGSSSVALEHCTRRARPARRAEIGRRIDSVGQQRTIVLNGGSNRP